MEVVLLWIDDLDDLVFLFVSSWMRLRRVCLQVGLLAAFLLAGVELYTSSAVTWTPMLAVVAGASVALWTAGAMLFAVARRTHSMPALGRA